MPALQPAELQGVLQSQALCIRAQRQRLPQKEKTKTQGEKSPGIGKCRIEKGRHTASLFLFDNRNNWNIRFLHLKRFQSLH